MVNLEIFSDKHLDKTYQWMLDEDLRRYFLFRKKLSPNEHQLWFKNYLQDKSQEILAIYDNTIHVGNIGLKNIDTLNNNAETWIYLGDASIKGKGVGIEVYKQLCDIWRNKFHKIYAHIAEFNLSSIKMYQKAGFILEGDFKDQLYWEDRYYNLLRFAIYL
jgi:RimJ/RimL family protein N-acetyltransferase